jgi:hypothetical protein
MVLRTLPILLLVLYVGIVWVVVKKFRQTHNFGFLILGCGVLVWPTAVDFVRMSVLLTHPHFAISDITNFFPLTLVATRVTPGFMVVFLMYGSKLIQASLILTGLLVVGRSINGTQQNLAAH